MYTSDHVKRHTGTARPLWLGLLGLFLLVVSSAVFAQAGLATGNDLLEPYRNFKPSSDMATRLMEGLLGPVYTSPFTAGLTTNTIFGSVFLVFNVIVFAVGTVFASYGVVAGIVQTAHEGVVLGKRMSAVWMPVRMVTGIGGLVPAFGGFSLSQVAMILATSWGISFGNFAYDKALEASATSATLVNPSFSRTDSKNDANALANGLFQQRLCELRFERKVKALAEEKQPPTDDIVLLSIPNTTAFGADGGRLIGNAVGTVKDPTACWAVGIQRKKSVFSDVGGSEPKGILGQGAAVANSVYQSAGLGSDTGRQGDSILGFRSDAVDYKAINQAVWVGYAAAWPAFRANVRKLAEDYDKSTLEDKAATPKPVQEISAAGISFAGNVKGPDISRSNISSKALANMRKYGFFSAGSYYSTHAEVNAAVMQASQVVDFRVIGPSQSNSLTSDDFTANKAADNREKEQDSNPTGCIPGLQVDTGNCSLGQKIVGLMMDAATAGAGGASTMIDPIIAMKNVGDYLMTMGEAILAATVISGAGPDLSGTAAAVVGKVPFIGSIVSDAIKAIGVMAPYIGGLMFAIGALCAIYLPMVPFINWVSGLVQYCCIVVESFAAAPLWALAHLEAQGEGMGQRTEKGYLYLLNLLFRPILMVVAFFAASALVILLGSLVFQMFAPAMAAAQGNSVTGLFSAIGYVFMFFVIMQTLITGLFHLVMELADDAIGWVGGIGRQNIGRDTEGKVSNLFMAGGRFGAGGVDRMKPRGGGGSGGVASPPGK